MKIYLVSIIYSIWNMVVWTTYSSKLDEKKVLKKLNLILLKIKNLSSMALLCWIEMIILGIMYDENNGKTMNFDKKKSSSRHS